MTPPGALSPGDYAALSALFDELSELDPEAQARRLALLRGQAHPQADRLARMLEALSGPRTDELLPRLQQGAAPARPGAHSAGKRIGPWRLESPLGSGGMAEVWLALRDDGRLKREVALKLLYPMPGAAGAARAARFERERDILAALRHPHIAALLDAGIEPDGQAWLALERVDGERITEWCDAHRATLEQRIGLFRQVLLAVQHAHAQLVIHRDLKPGNILVSAQGEVRLLDFGIAKLLADGEPSIDDTALTQQAGRPLTPRYASPEQMRGEPLSTASDVYALGVLLHELLTGRLPYNLAHGGAAELERAIVEVEPELPSRALPSAEVAAARATTPRALQRALAPELDAVLLRALAKLPAARYSSVDALLADIDRWSAGVPVTARTPGAWFRLRRFVARHPLGVGAGVLAGLSLLGLSGTALVFGLRAQQQSERAVLTRDFVLDMFRKADVDQSKGADISARDMLDWGRRRAAALPTQPDLRAELLMGIGESQSETSDYAGAALSFAEAAQLYRTLAMGDGVVLAEAQRAEIAVRQGDLAQAALFVAAARAALPPKPAPALRARVEQAAGMLAMDAGRFAEAAAHDNLAADAAAQAWAPTDLRRLRIVRQLAQSEAMSGQPEAALTRLERLLQQTGALSGLDPRERAGIEFERAAIAWSLARYREVASRMATALPRCEAAVGRLSEVCNMSRRLRAAALLRQGDLAAAEALLPDIDAEIASPSDPRRQAEAVIVACRIRAGLGRVDDADRAWRALREIALGQGGAPVPENLRIEALLAYAEGMLHAGRPADARAWIGRAHDRIALAAVPMPSLAVRAEVFSAASELLDQPPEAALATLQSAVQEAARVLGDKHPQRWLYALNTLEPLRTAGRDAEANTLLAQALPVLSESLGADAPTLQRVAGWQRKPEGATPAAPLALLF